MQTLLRLQSDALLKGQLLMMVRVTFTLYRQLSFYITGFAFVFSLLCLKSLVRDRPWEHWTDCMIYSNFIGHVMTLWGIIPNKQYCCLCCCMYVLTFLMFMLFCLRLDELFFVSELNFRLMKWCALCPYFS